MDLAETHKACGMNLNHHIYTINATFRRQFSENEVRMADDSFERCVELPPWETTYKLLGPEHSHFECPQATPFLLELWLNHTKDLSCVPATCDGLLSEFVCTTAKMLMSVCSHEELRRIYVPCLASLLIISDDELYERLHELDSIKGMI